MMRQDGRAFDELRPIKITTDFVKFAEGSCLIQCGDTMVPLLRQCGGSAPTPCGGGYRLGDGGVFHAAPANRERSKRDISKLKLSPQRGNSAPGGPVSAGCSGFDQAGRAYHYGGL